MSKEFIYCVYIMSNRWRTTFYVGVTNDIYTRVLKHRASGPETFCGRYHVFDLVYVETTNDIHAALEREKQLKRWHREWKINLIKTMNPEMEDLFEKWYGGNSLPRNGDAETSLA